MCKKTLLQFFKYTGRGTETRTGQATRQTFQPNYRCYKTEGSFAYIDQVTEISKANRVVIYCNVDLLKSTRRSYFVDYTQTHPTYVTISPLYIFYLINPLSSGVTTHLLASSNKAKDFLPTLDEGSGENLRLGCLLEIRPCARDHTATVGRKVAGVRRTPGGECQSLRQPMFLSYKSEKPTIYIFNLPLLMA